MPSGNGPSTDAYPSSFKCRTHTPGHLKYDPAASRRREGPVKPLLFPGTAFILGEDTVGDSLRGARSKTKRLTALTSRRREVRVLFSAIGASGVPIIPPDATPPVTILHCEQPDVDDVRWRRRWGIYRDDGREKGIFRLRRYLQDINAIAHRPGERSSIPRQVVVSIQDDSAHRVHRQFRGDEVLQELSDGAWDWSVVALGLIVLVLDAGKFQVSADQIQQRRT